MEMRVILIQVAEHLYFNVKLKSATFKGSLLCAKPLNECVSLKLSDIWGCYFKPLTSF